MPIYIPDVIKHNNPLLPIADVDNITGGFKQVSTFGTGASGLGAFIGHESAFKKGTRLVALDTSYQYMFTGSTVTDMNSWTLFNIMGMTGSQGTRGPQGFSGSQGVKGFQGPQGFQGIQGSQGLKGFQGNIGFQGNKGNQGVQGIGQTGPQGIRGSQGILGPQGATSGLIGPQGPAGSLNGTGSSSQIAWFNSTSTLTGGNDITRIGKGSIKLSNMGSTNSDMWTSISILGNGASQTNSKNNTFLHIEDGFGGGSTGATSTPGYITHSNLFPGQLELNAISQGTYINSVVTSDDSSLFTISSFRANGSARTGESVITTNTPMLSIKAYGYTGSGYSLGFEQRVVSCGITGNNAPVNTIWYSNDGNSLDQRFAINQYGNIAFGASYSYIFPLLTGLSGDVLRLTSDNSTFEWHNISSNVSGSGTTDYVTRWSDSSTLSIGNIMNDGNTVSINTALDPSATLKVYNNGTSLSLSGIYVTTEGSTGTGEIIGGVFETYHSESVNSYPFKLMDVMGLTVVDNTGKVLQILNSDGHVGYVSLPVNLLTYTYDELNTLKNYSLLIPGQKYEISDFVTTYNQPVTNTIKSGSVENLIIEAVSSNEFYTSATSLQFSKDIIYYNFNDNLCEDNVTPRTGKIIYRENPILKLVRKYDWRNVKFCRWALTADDFVAGAYTKGTYFKYKNGGDTILYFVARSGTYANPNANDIWQVMQLKSDSYEIVNRFCLPSTDNYILDGRNGLAVDPTDYFYFNPYHFWGDDNNSSGEPSLPDDPNNHSQVSFEDIIINNQYNTTQNFGDYDNVVLIGTAFPMSTIYYSYGAPKNITIENCCGLTLFEADNSMSTIISSINNSIFSSLWNANIVGDGGSGGNIVGFIHNSTIQYLNKCLLIYSVQDDINLNYVSDINIEGSSNNKITGYVSNSNIKFMADNIGNVYIDECNYSQYSDNILRGGGGYRVDLNSVVGNIFMGNSAFENISLPSVDFKYNIISPDAHISNINSNCIHIIISITNVYLGIHNDFIGDIVKVTSEGLNLSTINKTRIVKVVGWNGTTYSPVTINNIGVGEEGQITTYYGTDDVNTVTIDTGGTGYKLNGGNAMILHSTSSITFRVVNSINQEEGRSSNS